MELIHLESLETILRMARQNKRGIVGKLEDIAFEAGEHYQRLRLRDIDQ